MRRLRKGQPEGPQYTVHQYANDWITVKECSQVFRPSQVQLDEPDFDVFLADNQVGTGFFWEMWRLEENGRFTRLKGSGV